MMDPNEIVWLRNNGLTIDLFAGGGGFSVGFEKALGRHVDIALNHDPYAVTLHAANHPRTRHLCQDIATADPIEATRGRPVFWIHASPACTQFSRSRRALPAEKQLRELGWKAFDWVEKTQPVVFSLENVSEYRHWGDLDADGFPIKEKAGETWEAFLQAFRDLGYAVDWKILNSADYGAPTSRERLIMVARRDGLPIRWPVRTHGAGTQDYAHAGDHIDWSIPAQSIFTRKKALAPATVRRILKGYDRFIANNPKPYLAPPGTVVGDGNDRSDLVAAFLTQNHADLPGRSLRQPLSTICTKGAGQGLVTMSFLNVMRNNAVGTALDAPANTICAGGGHFAEIRVASYAIGYYSEGGGQLQDLGGPIGTITTKDRFAIVELMGYPHIVTDIGFRFLTAGELWNLQGFPKDYKKTMMANGRPLTGTVQKRLVGNSVVPILATAIARANLQDIDDLEPMKIAA